MAVKAGAIGIAVKDMAAALKFYRLLGLDIAPVQNDEDHVEAISNGYRLMWDTEALIQSFDPGWSPGQGQRVTVAFECSSREEVDEVYRRLVEAGYRGHKEPWDAFWGMRYAVVEDPDGTHIDLYC